MSILSIEKIDTCQQDMYKLTMDNDKVYYHKNFRSNQSWWTFTDENISEREWDVYQKFFMWQIPVAHLKYRSDYSFLTEEIKGIPLSQDLEGIGHFNAGDVLRKIHSHGYIHGDFHHENIFIEPYEGYVKAVIDFEESVPIDGEYPRLPEHLKPDPMYDLTTFLRSCKHYDKENFYKDFLQGYGLPEHLIDGIRNWNDKIGMRNQNFRDWCKKENITSLIC